MLNVLPNLKKIMSNKVDIKTLESLKEGDHKAFETVFITYYNKTKTFIYGYLKSESDVEELAEDLFVSLLEKTVKMTP